MLKNKIFLGNSLLLLGLICLGTAMLIFSAIQENRLETKNTHMVSASALIGDLERFIHWDDRVAISQTISRQMSIHSFLEYVFVTQNGSPYVDSFEGAVPPDLLKTPRQNPQEPYSWEFLNREGDIFYDFVVPISDTGAILRIGMKQSSIDQKIHPVLFAIVSASLAILLLGLAFSYRIATWATKEITLLSDAIKSFDDNGLDPTGPHNDSDVADLAEQFRGNVAKRQKAETELRQLQSELNNIINSMPSVLIGVNAAGEVSQWNKTAEQVTGISVAKAKNRQLAEVFPQLAEKTEKIAQSIKTKEIIKETNLPRQTGTYVHYDDVTIYPLVASDTQGAVIRIDDVTEKVHLEEQLAHSHKMEAIGQLAGGVAHDFNNMLGVIIGATNLLKSKKRNLDDKGIAHVDAIMQAATRAADLTTQLLAFARKDRGDFKTVDIHNIMDDLLTLLNRTLDKKIRITIAKNAEHHWVAGDSSKLQSSLLNLCLNASHAMPDGGKITITTQNKLLTDAECTASSFAISAGRYLEVTVCDTGCGIPLSDQQKIFEPFFTTKALGKGTGLGLAAVYATVLGHHGAIGLHSEVGSGTTFTILLPCSETDVKPAPAASDVTSGSGTILLVDDEEFVRTIGKELLVDMGYQVLLAENGRRAVEIYREQHENIDLVILDMIMPEMNGRDAFLQMHAIDNSCKAIISSGFLNDDSLEDLKALGLKGLIRKPYKDYELSQLVANSLAREHFSPAS